MNDLAFFNKLDVVQQKTIIKELREINNDIRVEKPYRMTLLESSMPRLFKSAAIKKISMLKHMEPGSGEYYKIKNWVDTFMRIPFGKYLTLPIQYEDGIDTCHEFMANAQKTLNDAVWFKRCEDADNADVRSVNYQSQFDWHGDCYQRSYGDG